MSGALNQTRLRHTVQNQNPLGIGIAIFGWLTLACMNAGSKILVTEYPVVQILWFRLTLTEAYLRLRASSLTSADHTK